ncbi:hypothetical protein P8452_09883 [Trifolium repens]|nr:hypothetical protein P8452_09883 [Trifolium repens]
MTARYSIFLFALEFNGGITIKACVVVNGIVVLLDWCCEKIKTDISKASVPLYQNNTPSHFQLYFISILYTTKNKRSYIEKDLVETPKSKSRTSFFQINMKGVGIYVGLSFWENEDG